MIEYDDIFDDRFIMFKTIPLEGVRTISEKSRKCNTCSEYNKGKCIPVGIIINPNITYCSWHKGNGNGSKRDYRGLNE